MSATWMLRGGPGYDWPCNRPEVVECAVWECQHLGRCRVEPTKGGETRRKYGPREWPKELLEKVYADPGSPKAKEIAARAGPPKEQTPDSDNTESSGSER